MRRLVLVLSVALPVFAEAADELARQIAALPANRSRAARTDWLVRDVGAAARRCETHLDFQDHRGEAFAGLVRAPAQHRQVANGARREEHQEADGERVPALPRCGVHAISAAPASASSPAAFLTPATQAH
jgi:hypothetical protein